MSCRVAVVDYGMGNLRSVAKAIEHVAPEDRVLITSNAAAIAAAEERARAIVKEGRTAGGPAPAETIDLSAIKRTRAGGADHE